jgi:hypothetical protein
MMSEMNIGCCGAYCETCKEWRAGRCKSCAGGYADGERDLTKAKCAIKRCCIAKGFVSCADCPLYDSCEIVQTFHNHAGYKYGKYKQTIAFIRENGYDAFCEAAHDWTNAYGKYPKV